MTHLIEVEHLSKYFGDIPAVRDVSFTVAEGSILGFLGPNGAGKSTTMKVLNCFLPPTSGRASVAGYDVFKDSIEVRRRIGYLPENPAFYEDMTAESYLHFAAKIRGVPKARRAKRVDEVMERTRCANVRRRLIRHLSKGYRQRLGLAQALVHDPPVLILDEPTSGLDPRQIIEAREMIKDLRGSHTVILSTHILPEVSQVCDEVLIINKGTIVAEDSPEELNRRLRGTESLALEVRGPLADVRQTLEGIPGILTVTPAEAANNGGPHRLLVEAEQDRDVREDIARAVVESGWGLLHMAPRGVSLEEIFLQLTTDETAQPEHLVASTEEPSDA